MLVANITIDSNGGSDFNSFYDNHIGNPSTIQQLHEAPSGKLMLAPNQMRNLLTTDGYREIRARCYKPWHQRTMDLVVFGDFAINAFLSKTAKKDGSLCSNVRFLTDDNSKMQSSHVCNQIWMKNIENYWDSFVFVAGNVHYLLRKVNGQRVECDDKLTDSGYMLEGNWMFYVR